MAGAGCGQGGGWLRVHEGGLVGVQKVGVVWEGVGGGNPTSEGGEAAYLEAVSQVSGEVGCKGRGRGSAVGGG